MTTNHEPPPAAFLVFADDWGRHPSSSQHLFGRLLNRYPVIWVNTIGTRRPQFDVATLSRGLEKVRQWSRRTRRGQPPSDNLRVLNPVMWPSFSSPLARRLNRRLLLHQLGPIVKSLAVPVIAVSVIPLVADLMGRLPVARWVYYCVDDFALWPGLDRPTLEQTERRLVGQADQLIAVSETLQAKLHGMGRAAGLLTHGVDLDHWNELDRLASLPQIESLESPRVVFWGVVDHRMDTEFVNRLAGDLTRGTIVLVGPESDPDPRLYQSGRVVRVPPVPYEMLPSVACGADVLVMPYSDIPVNQAIQPLKLKEYLATGRPVVARDLPTVRPWADCLDLAATPEEFSLAVRTRLIEGVPTRQRIARQRLTEESWAAKAAEFERIVLGSLSIRMAS